MGPPRQASDGSGRSWPWRPRAYRKAQSVIFGTRAQMCPSERDVLGAHGNRVAPNYRQILSSTAGGVRTEDFPLFGP
jgi:hypothetical protein